MAGSSTRQAAQHNAKHVWTPVRMCLLGCIGVRLGVLSAKGGLNSAHLRRRAFLAAACCSAGVWAADTPGLSLPLPLPECRMCCPHFGASSALAAVQTVTRSRRQSGRLTRCSRQASPQLQHRPGVLGRWQQSGSSSAHPLPQGSSARVVAPCRLLGCPPECPPPPPRHRRAQPFRLPPPPLLSKHRAQPGRMHRKTLLWPPWASAAGVARRCVAPAVGSNE